MNNIIERVLLFNIAVPIIILAIFFPVKTHIILFLIFAVAIPILASIEISQMIINQGIKINKLFLVVVNLLIFVFSYSYANNFFNLSTNKVSIPLAFVFFILTLSFIYAQDFFKKDLKHSFEKMAYLVFGILYIGAPSFCLPLILNVSLQPESKLPLFYNIDSQGTLCGSFLILFMVVLIWSNDIFAYLCGMLLGRKNVIGLAASPKKSWAGYIGATIFTFVFTFVYYIIFTKVFKFMNFELLFYILAAFLACIAVPLGDLVESIIKRSVNLKDSGNIILGRGGILDSVDSILFFIPLYFIYLQLYFSLK